MTRKRKDSGARPSSWREIQQKNRRARTPVSRRRAYVILARAGMVAAGLAVGLGGVGYGTYFIWTQSGQVSPFEREQPVTRIVFDSDGVLNGQWFSRHSPVPVGTDIFKLDIHAMKRDVESLGQVREASVSVELPGTVHVRVREHVPVLRAFVRGADGGRQTLLVARDGSVYEGALYPTETLRRLPGLTGVRLVREEDGYRPLEGIGAVAELIDLARDMTPHIAADWRWIDLSRYRSDPGAPGNSIVIHGRHIERTVLHPTHFALQLERLDGVLRSARQRAETGIAHIDLSYADRAIVRFRDDNNPQQHS
ncbi:MAG: FtsQ-type POTRA domain-containing protein [Opitutales bacterium]|nr:FtsQ-type POTRA domain-containing protein [Opitutales bacterium]